MDLLEALDQVRALLRNKGRLTYRMLRAQFQLGDEALEAIKEELIEGEQVATDENGKVLVWVGSPNGQPARSGEQSQAAEGARSRPAPAAPSAEAERRQLT